MHAQNLQVGGDTVLGQKISLPTHSIYNTKRKIPLMLSGK
jgi:hypothetical protein